MFTVCKRICFVTKDLILKYIEIQNVYNYEVNLEAELIHAYCM